MDEDNVVDLVAHRRALAVKQALAQLQLGQVEAPRPPTLGWIVLERDDQGRELRWLHPGYRAIIGYVPGQPDWVFLDYQHECLAWQMTLDELVVGLESGILPPPEALVGPGSQP